MSTQPTPAWPGALSAEQPPPVPNGNRPIVEMVIEDMAERMRVGVQRYGTPLQAHNGRDALRDAYEESLDQTIYLRQAIEERDHPLEAVRALQESADRRAR